MDKSCGWIDKKMPTLNKKFLFLSDRFLLTVSVIFLLSLIGLTSFTLFTNFDYTDEGLYLHLLIHGKNTLSLSPFYLLFHHVGEYFNHALLGYRFLTFSLLSGGNVLLALACWAYVKENKTNTYYGIEFFIILSILLIISFGFFQLIPTLSYNAVATFASLAWMAGILLHLKIHEERPVLFSRRFLAIGLIAISIVLAFSSRPSFGIILLIATPILLSILSFFFSYKVKSDILLYIVINMVTMGIYVSAYYDVLKRIVSLYPLHLQLSHKNLLGKYFKTIVKFSIMEFGVLTIVSLVFLAIWYYLTFHREELKRGNLQQWVTTFISSAYIFYLLSNLVYFSLISRRKLFFFIISFFAVSGTLYIAYLFFFKNTLKKDILFFKKRVVLLVLPFFVAIISNLGTNTNIILRAGYSMSLMGLLFPVFLFDLTEGFKKRNGYVLIALIALTMTFASLVLQKQYLQYYRNASYKEQKSYSYKSPYLKNIKIEKEIAQTIDSLITALENVDFDFEKDRIFAFPDLPGFVAASGAKSFGSVWNFTAYENYNLSNCAYIDFEPIGDIKYIYILSGRELDKDLSACLLRKIKSEKNMKKVDVGTIYHYRNKKKYHLQLEGPYSLKK